jgi:hypothetical protein
MVEGTDAYERRTNSTKNVSQALGVRLSALGAFIPHVLADRRKPPALRERSESKGKP